MSFSSAPSSPRSSASNTSHQYSYSSPTCSVLRLLRVVRFCELLMTSLLEVVTAKLSAARARMDLLGSSLCRCLQKGTLWSRKRLYRTSNKSQVSQLEALIRHDDYQRLADELQNLTERQRSKLSAYLVQALLSWSKISLLEQLARRSLLDVNAPLDKYSWTALHRAAYSKNVRLLRILLDNGAQVGLTDTNGNTALHIAIQSCGRNTAQSALHTLATMEALLAHARRREPDLDLANTGNAFGKTPLHYAVLIERTKELEDWRAEDAVRLLLRYGAHPDRVDLRRRTPLYAALTESRVADKAVINSLLEADCDSLDLAQCPLAGLNHKVGTLLEGQVASLKSLCRSCLVKHFANCVPRPRDLARLRSLLPRDLFVYLNRRLLLV